MKTRRRKSITPQSRKSKKRQTGNLLQPTKIGKLQPTKIEDLLK